MSAHRTIPAARPKRQNAKPSPIALAAAIMLFTLAVSLLAFGLTKTPCTITTPPRAMPSPSPTPSLSVEPNQKTRPLSSPVAISNQEVQPKRIGKFSQHPSRQRGDQTGYYGIPGRHEDTRIPKPDRVNPNQQLSSAKKIDLTSDSTTFRTQRGHAVRDLRNLDPQVRHRKLILTCQGRVARGFNCRPSPSLTFSSDGCRQ